MHPLRHHYIPVFYLKRWATEKDGKLCQFSRPFGDQVKPLRVHPSGTGFADGLYELQDFPSHLAQQVEENFFRPMDSLAADALAHLEANGGDGAWTDRLRSAWARFIISLWLRCPEDLEAMRELWKEVLTSTSPEDEENYRKTRASENPQTFSQYLAELPTIELEKSAFETFVGLIDSEKVGQILMNMSWQVFVFPDQAPPLFSSDRPIVRTATLDGAESHVAIPISARKLFVAANSRDYMRRAASAPRKQLAKEMNRLVVSAASKYVYGENDRSLAFVQKWIGAKPNSRFLENTLAQLRCRG
ncbi:DUF4238 domain-containing protein [Paradevosia shaoguanensis]|uniref:DUF4238 domain-containing protein n=1 Tax=Paradevosia shaoguanensis TaxID=1335043 RepID=UPI003C755FB1